MFPRRWSASGQAPLFPSRCRARETHPITVKPKTHRAPAAIEVPTGTVTAITASARAAGRYDLLVDQAPVARLSIHGIERLKLRIGLAVDVGLAAAIADEATVSRAYDRAMMMLAARGRASGELKRLLVRKGEEPRVAAKVIDRLTAAGFLDDDAFARQFTRSKTSSGISRRRIEQELGRKGVDRSVAADAVAETFVEEDVDESAAIERAAEKKLRTLGKVDEPTRRRRLYSYLARRGFDVDAINAVVARLGRDSVAEP
jgi:regulatory protein